MPRSRDLSRLHLDCSVPQPRRPGRRDRRVLARTHLGSCPAMTETQDPPSEPRTFAPEDATHDVLAAEAFAMPAPDPTLHHGPIVLPDDPTGIEEPHDILAAEEFPMPAACSPRSSRLVGPGKASHRIGIAVAAGLLLVLVRGLVARRRST